MMQPLRFTLVFGVACLDKKLYEGYFLNSLVLSSTKQQIILEEVNE